jgi:hypothetical protein
MPRYAIVENNAPAWINPDDAKAHVSEQRGRPTNILALSSTELKAHRIYEPIRRYLGESPNDYERVSAPVLRYDLAENEVYAETQAKAVTQEQADGIANALRAGAKMRVKEFAEYLGESLTGPVPHHEQLAWLKKEDIARRYVATEDHENGALYTAAELAFLQRELSLTNGLDTDMDTLAGKIIARADLYSEAVGLISGLRRATQAQIDALGPRPTTAQINAVLDAAQAAAEAELARLNG